MNKPPVKKRGIVWIKLEYELSKLHLEFRNKFKVIFLRYVNCNVSRFTKNNKDFKKAKINRDNILT